MRKPAQHLALILLTCVLASSQQYKVLYNFGSGPTDGIAPAYNPVRDSAGNFYGVTITGGISGTCAGGGCGIVFELSPDGSGGWSEYVLHYFCKGHSHFDCPDGGIPNGLTIDSSGNLYGTTEGGGLLKTNGQCLNGCGVAYELSPPSSPGGAWTYTLLYDFCSDEQNFSCDDGAVPQGSLTLDASGNLYGTADDGPNGAGAGVVFELSPGSDGWTESVLYNFCSLPFAFYGCEDGNSPQNGVTFDASGNLYSTTSSGGSATRATGGAIFKLSPGSSGWTETVVAVLPEVKTARGQSGFPGPVSLDPAGNLYTTSELGGNYNDAFEGNGGIYRLGSNGRFSSFFLFDYSDGSEPIYTGVLLDPRHDVLYGVTGGADPHYKGNAFQIDSSGNETVLYNFCQQTNCTDGSGPAGLYEDASGTLFGVTSSGGENGTALGGDGVMFEIIP
jgi:hypothetical protein